MRRGRLGLALPELRQAGLERPLAAVEVGGPGREALLQALLHLGNRFGELGARPIGLARDQVAPLDRELPLLLAEEVAVVARSRARITSCSAACSSACPSRNAACAPAEVARRLVLVQPQAEAEDEPDLRDAAASRPPVATISGARRSTARNVEAEDDPEATAPSARSTARVRKRRSEPRPRTSAANERATTPSPSEQADLERRCHAAILRRSAGEASRGP